MYALNEERKPLIPLYMVMFTILTITGIRPDFVRMANVIKLLDESPSIHHILLHTGQHYDALLSDVIFEDLQIRKPDIVLNTGKESSDHFEQLSYLSKRLPQVLKEKKIEPDLIVFLGDSNSVAISFPLKKEGYRICHVEAGMRSNDKRMLEEMNRTVCDHCSDLLFVYHEDYAENLKKENVIENVHVVGNTIVEVATQFAACIMQTPKRKDVILMDIHRPENFKDPIRLKRIVSFAATCASRYGLPVKLLYFKRLQDHLTNFDIDLGPAIEMVPLMSYKTYLDEVYHAAFLISDSGTGQEEPALFGTKVIVPRDYTERPQSYSANCSFKFDAGSELGNAHECFDWIDRDDPMSTKWLGDGETSKKIVDEILRFIRKACQVRAQIWKIKC